MIYCAGVVGVGDGEGVVGDVSWLLSLPALSTLKVLSVMRRVTSSAGVVSLVLRVLALLVMPTVRVSQVMLWWMSFFMWWSDGEGVAGDDAVCGPALGWSSAVLGVGSRHFWRRAWRALVVGWMSVGLRSWWCWSSSVSG